MSNEPIGIGLGIALVGSEIAVPIAHPGTKVYSRLLALIGNYYMVDDVVPFTFKPNYRGTNPSQEYPGKFVTVTINSLGSRAARSSG